MGHRNPQLYLELSRIQSARGDNANARLTLQRGRELFPDNPEFQLKLDALPAEPAKRPGTSLS